MFKVKIYNNIKDENKLIMDFMQEPYSCTNDYSSSWDLLLPVIERIKNLNYTNLQFKFAFQYSVDVAAWTIAGEIYKTHISNYTSKSWLENNFDSVVEFVKFYNTFVIKKDNGEEDINKKFE